MICDAPQVKKCGRCKTAKPVSDFYRRTGGCYRRTGAVGRASYCKACCRQRDIERGYDLTLKGQFSRAKINARARRIGWSLTFEQFAVLRGLPCEYCDGPLPPTADGLDRVDSNLGYIDGNCVPCCTGCNKIKGAYVTYAEMKSMKPTLIASRRRLAAECIQWGCREPVNRRKA